MIHPIVILPFAVWFGAGARAVLLEDVRGWSRGVLFLLYTTGMMLTLISFIDISPVSAFFFSSVLAAALVVLTMGTFIVFLITYSFAYMLGERIGNPESPRRRAREEMLFRNRNARMEQRRRDLESSLLGTEDTDARQEAWRSIDDMEQRNPGDVDDLK